jgi:hypothetical protein
MVLEMAVLLMELLVEPVPLQELLQVEALVEFIQQMVMVAVVQVEQ